MKTRNEIHQRFVGQAKVMTTLFLLLITVTAWAGQPDKYLDECTGGAGFIHVQGWAFDPDASTQSIDVQVYVYTDASCTCQYGDVHTITADVSRPDVNAARNITGNHGFSADIPIDDPGDYWVKVFAIDTNGDGNPQIGNTTKVTVTESQMVMLSGSESYTAQDGNILTGSTSGTVTIADGASITLRNVTITGGIICAGSATITLVGTNNVRAGYNKPGIYVAEVGTLTIGGSGILNAAGNGHGAAIGASTSNYTKCGNIIITGGTINATSDGNAAAIGSGGAYTDGGATLSWCGDITITGGVVTAYGGPYAPGIGSGYQGSCGNITITDGVTRVIATGGSDAPRSIGAGSRGICGTVTIFGVVYPDGITESSYTYVKPTDLTLLGGNYTAQDGDVLTGSTSGTVTIADGASITLNNVTISGGIVCAGSATITLIGTNRVSGKQYMAGIQVGGSGTTLTIKGQGSLTATGNLQSAGIGLSRAWGSSATGGDIIIESGNITATGGPQNADHSEPWGAGIGTGVAYNANVSLGNITIKGGTVTATGTNGIGTGYCYNNASNTIGSVTVYDAIDMVDASSITGSVTYMHGETNVTDNASNYFTITEDGSRRIIVPKDYTDYTITIVDGFEHGTITGPATAKYMEKVTITATPDLGYHLSSLVVKDAQGNDVATMGSSFLMPKSNVTVSASFEEGTHGTTEFALVHYNSGSYVTDAIYDGLTTVNLQKNTSYSIKSGEWQMYYDHSKNFLLDNDTYDVTIPYSGGTGTFLEQGNSTYFSLNYDAEAGFYDITLTDLGNDRWHVSILKTIPVVDNIPDQEYTGNAITPEPLVVVGSLNITKGTDYEYSYENNTNAGTAKVIVTFKGDYAAYGSVEKEFNIYKYVSLSGNQDYTALGGEILMGSTSNWVWIADGASITLNNVTISGGIVCAGSATITLIGTNRVSGKQYMAGIQVGGSGTTLTIKGQGSLTATGNLQSAGIGLSRAWGSSATGGDIIIESGNITATGGPQNADHSEPWGAGIGTGVAYNANVSLGNITIKGGTVTATGTNGIGTGYCYNNASNTIGSVTVYDAIDMVDASSITGSVTYMHGETNVTDNASNYFNITEDGSRRIIFPKDDTDYTITIAGGIEHGTVIADRTTAKLGEYVTLTATPASLYRLRSLTVKDASNNDVAVSNNRFVMPRSNVTVTATFEENTVSFDDYTSYNSVLYNVGYLTELASVTYRKTIDYESVGKYQAWLVPFDYTIKSEDMENFQFFKINMIANSPIPEWEATDEMWVFLKRLNAGDMLHANMPYVYKPKEAVTGYAFTTTNTTLKEKNEDVVLKTETAEEVYSFYATYENMWATPVNPFYYVTINGGISFSEDAIVGPYRWIIRKKSKYGDTPNYAPEMFFFDVEGDDATGIISPIEETEEEDAWYTLDGKMVNSKWQNGKLPKGIYIHNGKKVTIK